MKIFSFFLNNHVYPGLFNNEKHFRLDPHLRSIKQLTHQHEDPAAYLKKLISLETLEELALDEINFAPPIHFPNKLICVAGNYIKHLEEMGNQPDKNPALTQAPWMFLVPPTTVMIGHKQNVLYPEQANCIDYEGELACVIGKTTKNITPEQALDSILGYTIFNDVSERKPHMTAHVEKPRDLSFWYKKSFDTFGPTGPYIVLKNDINLDQIKITSSINGEVKQESHPKEMIFKIPELISFLSSFMTLEPGDIISTGTPSGVGAATGTFLNKGDTMSITIDGIGTLENTLHA